MSADTTRQTTARPADVPVDLIVNGEKVVTFATTLAELVDDMYPNEHPDATTGQVATGKVATALNGTFVPIHARAAVTLSQGDTIEILSPRQGG